MKRRHSDVDTIAKTRKYQRFNHTDNLSRLPEEVLLRILAFLPAEILVICQRLSRRFATLSNDPQLWKALLNYSFPAHAVKHPGIWRQSNFEEDLSFEPHAVDFKAQYRLRHNWRTGVCGVTETEIPGEPTPPLLLRIQGDIIITVNVSNVLRAWKPNTCELLAATSLDNGWESPLGNCFPTSLSVGQSNRWPLPTIVVGFQDGHFRLYKLHHKNQINNGSIDPSGPRNGLGTMNLSSEHELSCIYRHPASSNGALTAIAYIFPYLVTLNNAQLLSLYLVPEHSRNDSTTADPRLLCYLSSHTTGPPQCLSVRILASVLVVSIAYSVPTYSAGWSVGIQELYLTLDGQVIRSRLASTLQKGSQSPSPGLSNAVYIASRPTSLSYSHPYLLSSQPDNTLVLYLVKSSGKALKIGHGRRLWGHTSSVSDVHIGERGKAVSVSAGSGEVRVWNLEEIPRKRPCWSGTGTQVRPKDVFDKDSLSLLVPTARIRGSGFNDKCIVLHREEVQGKQHLLIYSFA